MSSLEASQTLRHQAQPLTALGRYWTSCVLGQSPPNTALDRGSCTFNNNHYFSTYRQLTCLHRYYVLVATCVFLRKHEWLRNACLAAVLVVPSISALHGIVLTSYHVNSQFQFHPKTTYMTGLKPHSRRSRSRHLWSLGNLFDRLIYRRGWVDDDIELALFAQVIGGDLALSSVREHQLYERTNGHRNVALFPNSL